jgi:hypothetical protein
MARVEQILEVMASPSETAEHSPTVLEHSGAGQAHDPERCVGMAHRGREFAAVDIGWLPFGSAMGDSWRMTQGSDRWPFGERLGQAAQHRGGAGDPSLAHVECGDSP